MNAPVASGVRVAYDALPPVVHEWVSSALGSPVVAATTQTGGFSPGVAARLRCADGTRAFVKAVSADANPDSPALHRREIATLRLLPEDLPVPRLLASYDVHPWVALLVVDVDGRQPSVPWVDGELERMIALTRQITECRGLDLQPARNSVARWVGWAKLPPEALDDWSRRHRSSLIEIEAAAPDAVGGDHLAHLDTRADNVLLTADRDWLVDWPWAAVGPRWLDAVVSAPAVAMQGGPEAEDYVRRSGLAGPSDAEAVTAVIAAFTGFLGWLASLPPPPGLPTIRPFQQAQADVGLAWLQQRTGWP